MSSSGRREGEVDISPRAIILVVFALIVSLGLMYAVWKIIGNLETDDHDEHEKDDDGTEK